MSERLEDNLEYQSLRALPPLFSEADSSVDLELVTRASLTGHCASDLPVCVTCHRDTGMLCHTWPFYLRHTWPC